MVDRQQHIGFDQLCLNGGGTNGQDGLIGEHRRTLGDGVDVTRKAEVAQVVQEILLKLPLAAQIGDVLLGEVELPDVLDDLLQASGDGEAAAVGHAAEEHVENHVLLVKAVAEIAVAHGDLIEVKEHGKVALSHIVPPVR